MTAISESHLPLPHSALALCCPHTTKGNTDKDLPPACCMTSSKSPPQLILLNEVQVPSATPVLPPLALSFSLTFRSALLSFFIPLMKSALPLRCCSNSPTVMSPFSIRTCGKWGSAEMKSTLGMLPECEGDARGLSLGAESSVWGGLLVGRGVQKPWLPKERWGHGKTP